MIRVGRGQGVRLMVEGGEGKIVGDDGVGGVEVDL